VPLSVSFAVAGVGKPAIPAGFRFVFVGKEFGPPVEVRFVTFIYVIRPINDRRWWFVEKAYEP
jgi:hypothetical protein